MKVRVFAGAFILIDTKSSDISTLYSPNWGCCRSPNRAYGHAWSSVQLQNNYGKKFIEADDNYVLLSNKIVVKDSTDNGYSILLVFDGILPADVTIETFARFDVSDIYLDETTNQSFVMMTAAQSHSKLEVGEKFKLVLGIRTEETNAKAFVESTNCK